MIGLVGTIWGMIMSFQEIATAAGSQPKPEKVAEGISTALFITLEGVSLAVPAIFFFALFRNRIAMITMEATKVADRTINVARGRPPSRPSRPDRPRSNDRRAKPMSATMSSDVRAEPNLTPLLDVVFQLITFFMLVINFSNDNYDQRVRLPVAGSARPVDDGDEGVAEDRLVLNVDRQGHLLMNGQVLTAAEGDRGDQAPGRAGQAQHARRPASSSMRRRTCRPRSSSAPTATRRFLVALSPDHGLPGQRVSASSPSRR